ncbi:AAA family ATPase [Francisella adeliensis]|uniref:AAA family ATPase n=1 Tax=Francisella adeliensis TaxID=2007306 RepID=A0A2Z4Y0B0_9GAMM|nr:MoxR family ATPase [Francisella adeliensis]AXA34484.1 AAA family ATPase [Francisella adeliensis]MBK2086203.1 MoxR family ATPase [Francisella adeliensis]MBK2096420.1 MoxR family ATPase [Francisella adeliensis]QIW12732.1 MoxR family ATPase [Francisella adeliensis]QIW14608.1 MoxR family ATPase [Francisella adeliensis]
MSVHSEFNQLLEFLNNRVVGQESLNKRLLIALLGGGHLLVEGAPGLAKTTAIKTLSESIDCSYHRVQFTPDLLPADLTGTEIYVPQQQSFEFQTGPLFHNLLLADEINRAPAKVQSALLEAMGEKQITVGKKTYPLSDLFMVMATQNPIEQEGTYPLPEAQLDRFMMFVKIQYPDPKTEAKILAISRGEALGYVIEHPSIHQDTIFAAQKEVLNVQVSQVIEEYMIELILASRHPEKYSQDIAKWVSFGASPRGTISLDRAARAHAWLNGCDFVSPSDIHAVIYEVLRHRILLTFEAEVDGVTTDDVITKLLKAVPIP